MSGGSFNYLYIKDLDELFWQTSAEDWDRMLDELDELCPEAAAEMRKIKLATKDFIAEHEKRWTQLTHVLKAVEYWRSCDYGKDQVDDAIAKYRAEREFVPEAQ